MTPTQRGHRSYDHRLRELVRETRDPSIAIDLGVPRSTARGWLEGRPKPVVTLDVLDSRRPELQREVLRLRHRARKLAGRWCMIRSGRKCSIIRALRSVREELSACPP